MQKLLALLVCLVPATAFAHPGHGTTDPDSWSHYLTEPEHVLALCGAVGLVVVVWAVLRGAGVKSRD